MKSKIFSLWFALAAIAPGSAEPANHEEYSPAVIDKLVNILDAIEATNARIALSYKKLLKKKIAVERPKSGFARDCIDAWGFTYGPAVGLRSKEDGAMSILFYYGERDEWKYLQLDQLQAESPKQFLIIEEKNGSPVYTNSTNLKGIADFIEKEPALEVVELPSHSTLVPNLVSAMLVATGLGYGWVAASSYLFSDEKFFAALCGFFSLFFIGGAKVIHCQRYENVQAAHHNLRKLFKQIQEANPA